MKEKILLAIKSLLKSIWLFPLLLTVALILLTAFQIHGSSIGIYHDIFYGDSAKDGNLLANKPQSIRSDEWIVNSQKAIAQSNNNYAPVNHNIGDGEDMSLIADAPHANWTTIFKPHNLGFLFLPFDNAFAFKWWAMSYFLVLSAYFFVLTLPPRKRLIAALLSLALLFSPFIQWWYSSGVLGVFYWTLFGIIATIRLLHARSIKQTLPWSIALTYIGCAFCLLLYPPFQIPAAIVAVAFIVGYIFDIRRHIPKKQLKKALLALVLSILAALLIVGVAAYQKRHIINIVQSSAYPGARVIKSGSYNLEHLLSGHLSAVFQSSTRANLYSRGDIGATNQSESSNFILVAFLISPILVYLLIKQYRKRRAVTFATLLTLGSGLLLLAWLFVPNLDLLGKITLLDKVPLGRALIGLGLLNFILIVIFIKHYLGEKKLSHQASLLYALVTFSILSWMTIHVLVSFPGFLSFKWAFLACIPLPVIIYLFLRKQFVLASAGLLLFTFLSACLIHPIYRGTDILTKTPLTEAIKDIGEDSDKRWVSDDITVENFATMSGEPSLTGVYVYPQLSVWDALNQPSARDSYNRYAHTNFTFDRDEAKNITPILSSPGPDQFNLTIEPCDRFLQKEDVGYLLTSVPLKKVQAPCSTLIKQVAYPRVTYYIYKLDW